MRRQAPRERVAQRWQLRHAGRAWRNGERRQRLAASGIAARRGLGAQQHPELHRHGRDARGAGRRRPPGAASSTWRSASRARRRRRRRALRRCGRSRRDTLGYTMALGSEALRAAHRAALHATGTASTSAPERIVVTTGSSAAFVLAFLAVFDAGDAVALPSPGYPCYRHILSALGQTAGAARDRAGRRTGCRRPRMWRAPCAATASRGC